jgi:hypothetical protein
MVKLRWPGNFQKQQMARARHDDEGDDDDEVPARIGRPRAPEEFGPRKPWAHESEKYWRKMQVIIEALEIGDISRDARLYLQGMLRRHDLLRDLDPKRISTKGEELVTLLLRTIAESTNGPEALMTAMLLPVLCCMEPAWVDRGLGG